jgi:hypothetical protein
MQHPSLEGLLAAVAHLETEVSWDVLLLQELCMPTETWPSSAEGSLAGHQLLVNTSKLYDTAILVHRRLGGKIVANFETEHAVGATIACGAGNVQVVSAHLPDSWQHSEEEYEGAIGDLAGQLDLDANHVVLGVDANTEVHFEPNDEQETVGLACTGRRATKREDLFLEGVVWPCGLRLLNTFEGSSTLDAAGGCWTHRASGVHGNLRQIDFLGHRCASNLEASTTASAVVLAAGHCRSDHRPLLFKLEGSAGALVTFETRPSTLRSWKASKRDLPALVSKLRSTVGPCTSCRQLQRALAVAAESLEPFQKTEADHNSPLLQLHPLERKLLEQQEAARGLAEGTVAMAKLRNAMWRTRKNLRRTRAIQETMPTNSTDATAPPPKFRRRTFQAARFPKALVDPDTGLQQQDQRQWPDLVGRYFRRKFDRGRLPAAVQELKTLEQRRSIMLDAKSDGRGLRDMLTITDVEKARGWLRRGAQTGRDNIPADLLLVLDSLCLQQVCSVFDKRIRGLAETGKAEDDIEDWKTFTLLGIPKKLTAQANLDRWRGIALCSAVLKWYEMCLWVVLDRHLEPLPDWIVGFRPGRQVLDIAAGIATALGKAREWGLPLVVVSVDVAAAFDNVSPELLGEALERRRAPHCLAFAAMRELSNLLAEPTLAGATAAPLPFAGGPQGRPRVPSSWSHILVFILAPLVEQWSNEAAEGEPSLFWSPEWQESTLLVWADNIFILADSPQKGALRARQVEQHLNRWGIQLGGDSLEWLVNEAAQPYKAGAETRLRAARLREVEELRVLGVMLDSRGSTETQVRHRLRTAAATWTRWKPLLCDPRVPLHIRLAKLDTTVGASALFGSGSWALTVGIARTLRIASNKWARFMLGRKPEERTWLEHVKICNTRVDRTRRIFQIPEWSQRALRAVHGWHGHLARGWLQSSGLLDVESDNPPCQALSWLAWQWRSESWWRAIQAMRPGEDEVDRNTVHPRRGAAAQHAEHLACLVWGVDWPTRTPCRAHWRADRDTFENNVRAYWHPNTTRKRKWLDRPLHDAGTQRSLRRRLLAPARHTG